MRLFREIDGDKIDIAKKHEREFMEFERLEKAMLDKIGDDAQFKNLFVQFQNASCNLNYADVEDEFKSAFIWGARVALEICGVECENE